MKSKYSILFLIVLAQFCCTSLWFASNGVMNDLALNFNLSVEALGHLTSSVQLGFISGTLVFAVLSLADRYSPSKVFCVSALLGALFNLFIIYRNQTFLSLLIWRYWTGFFLAGVYPIGMKIAADYFDKALDRSLGFLVGALVLGTSFPHFIKAIGATLPWSSVIISASILSISGGTLLYALVPDGPFRRPASKINFSIIGQLFKDQNFKSAAFGYFGHMWELYAFWAFVPVILASYSQALNVSLWAFFIIGIGSLGCVLGGYLSSIYGEKRIASFALGVSGLCCLLSYWAIDFGQINFLVFLCIWGFTVIMDSPLFSTLVAKNADSRYKATALTIVNCIGFAITILSIQLLSSIGNDINITKVLFLLAMGPIFGLFNLWRKN